MPRHIKKGVLDTDTTPKRGVLGKSRKKRGGSLLFSCQHDQLVGVYSVTFDRLQRVFLGKGQARKGGGS